VRLKRFTRKQQALRASQAAALAKVKRSKRALEQKCKEQKQTSANRTEAQTCLGMSFTGSNFTELGKRYSKSRTWVKSCRSKTLNAYLEGRLAMLDLHWDRVCEAGGAFMHYDNVRHDAALSTFLMKVGCESIDGPQCKACMDE
jgi:hypothetical protein